MCTAIILRRVKGLPYPIVTEDSHEHAGAAHAKAVLRSSRCMHKVWEQWIPRTASEIAGHLQGLVDYALAPAGGRVIAHTQLYPRPDDPATTTWSQIGAALIPGAMPAVHPKANKVSFSLLDNVFQSSLYLG